MLTKQQRHTLSQQPWFTRMASELQHALLDAASVRTFMTGQTVHMKDDQAAGFYGICEGRLRVAHHSADGREMLLALLVKGNWFGEIAMFDHQARTHTVYCDTATTLAMVPRQRFQQLLKRYPAFYPHFATLLCARVRSAFQFIDAAASLSLRDQLVRRLSMLMTSYGQYFPGAEPVTLNVSQEVLAQMINSSRQTVNQLLQGLKREGRVQLGYRSITIENPALFMD